MPHKILITDKLKHPVFESLRNQFELIEPVEGSFTADGMNAFIADIDVMITLFGFPVDEAILDKAKNLKLIANYGAGFNNIDVNYASKKGVYVTNTPNSVVEPTAELAMGLLLALCRKIAELDCRIKQGKEVRWELFENLGMTLHGKTLGIIGCGRIGTAFARKARAFGMKICYHNRNRKPAAEEEAGGLEYRSMDDLLGESDVISVHTPLSKETRYLVDEDELSKMKPDCLLINTARGAVINEKALIRHLQKGGIGGAGLDVFEFEPHVPDELRKMDQVVLVPHIGTASMEVRKVMAEEVMDNIRQFISGRTPSALVNK